MKKILFLIIVLVEFCSICMGNLTPNEVKFIQSLGCQMKGFYFKKTGELLFGSHRDRANLSQKQLYLIKNRSAHTIYLDFPAAHIGASAWVTQIVPANQWIGYLYIPGKDRLPIENGQTARTAWICASDFSRAQLSCQNVLSVYRIGSIKSLPPNMIKVLSHSTKSWWSGDAQTTIPKLFQSWMVAE